MGICTSKLCSLVWEKKSDSINCDIFEISSADSESTSTLPKGVSHVQSFIVATLLPIPQWFGPTIMNNSGDSDDIERMELHAMGPE